MSETYRRPRPLRIRGGSLRGSEALAQTQNTSSLLKVVCERDIPRRFPILAVRFDDSFENRRRKKCDISIGERAVVLREGYGV